MNTADLVLLNTCVESDTGGHVVRKRFTFRRQVLMIPTSITYKVDEKLHLHNKISIGMVKKTPTNASLLQNTIVLHPTGANYCENQRLPFINRLHIGQILRIARESHVSQNYKLVLPTRGSRRKENLKKYLKYLRFTSL